MENKYNKYPITPNHDLINLFQKYNTKTHFKCLEVGCNTGHNLKAIRDIFPEGEYYGVDINVNAIIEGHDGNTYNVWLNVGNIEEECLTKIPNMPKPVFFDYILLPDVLEHLSEPEITLKYLKTFLKPEGKIFTSIPNLMNWATMYDLLINGLFTYTDTGLLDSDHKHLFTRNEFILMAERAGYLITEALMTTAGTIFEGEILEFIEKLTQFGQSADDFKAFSYYFVLEHKKND